MLTGLPSKILGLTSDGESGVSLERQFFSAIKLVQRMQRDLTRSMNLALVAAGLPEAEINWPTHPFSTWAERVQVATQLVQANIWDQEMAREFLG